ncbi:MAG: hypothetical protein WA674_08440 [Candidatus Acidiferrales bacterium]
MLPGKTETVRVSLTRILATVGFMLFLGAQVHTNAQDALTASARNSQPQLFSESSRRVIFDTSAFNGPNSDLPYWDKGYLVKREIENFQKDLPNVAIFDGTGQKARQAVVWFPGSIRVLVASAAVTLDGRILAAGESDLPDGTAAPFIALTDLAGKLANVIQTKDFYPQNVCSAPDGTVWSFGNTFWDEEKRQPKPGETLRHFDFKKGQLGAYVPQATFGDILAPSALGYIRCTASSVSVYSRRANVYIEMPYAADAPQVYHIQGSSQLSLKGFASSGPKRVYGVLDNRVGSENTSVGLYTLAFDDKNMTVSWKPVDGAVGSPKQPGTIAMLWGIDGENLVIGRTQDPVGMTALLWVPSPAPEH